MDLGNFDEVLVFSLTVSDYCWHACNERVAMITHDGSRCPGQVPGETEGVGPSFCSQACQDGSHLCRGTDPHPEPPSPYPNHRNLAPVKTFLLRVNASEDMAQGLSFSFHLFSIFIWEYVIVLMHRYKYSWCAFYVCRWIMWLLSALLLYCQQWVHNQFCVSAGEILTVRFVSKAIFLLAVLQLFPPQPVTFIFLKNK